MLLLFNVISRKFTPDFKILQTRWQTGLLQIFRSIFISLKLSLANSFLLEMVIAKDHSLSLQYLHTGNMKNDKKMKMKVRLGWMTKY